MFDGISINTAMNTTIPNSNFAATVDGTSFGDCLNGALSADFLSNAPDRWAYKLSDKFAVDAAVDFLRENYGIDAYERQPTHTITEEQKEWLASRHDLNNLCGDNFPDLGENGRQRGISTNFKADLVYLGILSPDEARKLGEVPIYDKPMLRRVSAVGSERSSGTALELISDAVAEGKSMIAYVEELLMDRTVDHKDDEEYIERVREHIRLQQTLYDVLLSLY